MQKTLKRLFILLLSAALIACVALIAACDKGDGKGGGEETVAEGKMVIYVYKPDGTPVNGKTDGKNGKTVRVQFCIPHGGCTANNAEIGVDGKVELDINNDILNQFAGYDVNDSTEYVVHILNVPDTYLEDGDYGTFTKDTFHNEGKPYKITLKLKTA